MSGTAQKSCRGSAGFSIVEVLTGIGLMAVVSLVAVPNAREFTDRYQLMSAASQLSFEIARARMQAIGQNAFVRIRLLDSGDYIRERSSDNVTFVQDDVTKTLPSGITATAGDSGTPSFDRNGIAAVATSITLQNPRGSKTVQTNILGRVTISSVGTG